VFEGFLVCFGIHHSQSKKRLPVMDSFYETKSDIWAGLDQLGSFEYKYFE
jgi:hypothetical protein